MAPDERPAWLVELALALTAEPDLRPSDPLFVRMLVENSPCAWARIWARRGDKDVVVSRYPGGGDESLAVAAAYCTGDELVVDPEGHWALFALREIGVLEVDAELLTSADIDALAMIAGRFTQRVQASNLLESIVDHLPDMVFVKDAEALRFVHFNRAGEYLVGFPREEMLGRNDHDFFPQKEADFFTANDRAVLASGEVLDIPEEPIHTVSHGTRTLHTKKIPINGSDGRPRYLLGISRDITERKRIEERVMQSQKLEAVAHLTAGLAHNFNNAAMVISGYAELALMALGDGEARTSGFLHKLRRASSRVSDLADRLLGFARTKVLRPTVTDVSALLGETAHLLERVIPELVTVDVSGIEPGCYACVDRPQLEQVVVNLAVNARDAMPTGGTLVVGVSRSADVGSPSGEWVHITVTDSGHGMPEDVRERAFEPFFTTKKAGAGSGLGLFSTYEIVRRHDGQIEIDSTPGCGTCVRISLPTVEAPAGRLARPTPPRLPAGRGDETILLVEDDLEVRSVLAANLEAHGYGVLTAGNGAEALQLIDDLEEPIDLLLSDVVMPIIGGAELARRVRALWPAVKVVLVSGYTRDAEQLAGDPDLVFLAKPVETDRLMAALRSLLDPELTG